ncbi:MAG: ankyrin repeat domain-containing protein, partial [Cyanobacteriota bacterium]
MIKNILTIFFVLFILIGNTFFESKVFSKPSTIIEINQTDKNKLNNDFIKAINNSDLVEMKVLLEKGVDVNFKDKKGSTSLINATVLGKKDVVEFLIYNSANIDVTDRGGWSSLMLAANFGEIDILKFLISKGVHIEDLNKKGFTPSVI